MFLIVVWSTLNILPIDSWCILVRKPYGSISKFFFGVYGGFVRILTKENIDIDNQGIKVDSVNNLTPGEYTGGKIASYREMEILTVFNLRTNTQTLKSATASRNWKGL